MKLFLSIILSILFVTNCNNRITDSDSSDDNDIIFKTNKKYYKVNGNIYLKLTNNSDSALVIGLVCGEMLQIYYQKYENDTWSDNIDLYLLGCPTFIDSIQSKEEFSESIPASVFKSSGTFRLLVNENIISNSFTIN